MLNQFLKKTDAARVTSSLETLARHDISRCALTDGLAIEIHYLLLGVDPPASVARYAPRTTSAELRLS